MEGLTVRKLGPDNIMDIHALWKEAGLTFHPAGRDSIGHMTQELRDGRLFIAGAFLGQALLGVVLGNDDGRKGWINRLAVKPGYRNKGVARELVAFCEHVFIGQGLGLICCLVEENNEPSLGLFQECGYEVRKDIFYLRKLVKGQDW